MRRVVVKAPGSCGEFIQGIYDKSPCLVSCPVDLYAAIQITEGEPDRFIFPKAEKMVARIFEDYGIPRAEKHHIKIEMASEIPIEKGMASSTADISGLAKALSEYYELGLADRTIADLCIAIEPTDNIMFERLNLFNHVKGDILMDFNAQLTASILIVEFKGRVNTVNFHRQLDGYTEEEIQRFGGAVHQFKKGLAAQDLRMVGEACTESARLNQKILYKPHLEKMIRLSEAFGGSGIITGHSGTVVGVLYKDENFSYQEFMQQFLKEVPKEDYDALFLKNVIPGGIRTEVTN